MDAKVKIGLFGTGLHTYWGQFDGLLDELNGYRTRIRSRMERTPQIEVVDGGMVDSPERALEAAALFAEQRVDLGKANDEYFVNVFSCGLFTDVSQKTPTVLKNTFGKLAYYVGGLGELPNFRKMYVSIETEVGKYEGSSFRRCRLYRHACRDRIPRQR